MSNMLFKFLGTENEPIELYTNFFEVIKRPNWTLFQYHVDFEPKIESKSLRCGLLKQHDALFNHSKAFDGMTLYSMTKLDREVRCLLFFVILNFVLNTF